MLLRGQQILKVTRQAGLGPRHPTHRQCLRPLMVSSAAHSDGKQTGCCPIDVYFLQTQRTSTLPEETWVGNALSHTNPLGGTKASNTASFTED